MRCAILNTMRQWMFLILTLGVGTTLWGANDIPVPSQCTPDVNARLASLLAAGATSDVDNVMVCGLTTRSSRYQPGRAHGSHHVHSVLAHLPDGSSQLIEIVTNDELDGVITSGPHAQVFAYGQAFFSNTRQFAAGIHDTHCATHRGADNGWVVVNGEKHPQSCSGR